MTADKTSRSPRRWKIVLVSLSALIGGSALLAAKGCGCHMGGGFALQTGQAPANDLMAGAWLGRWTSSSGMSGKLVCSIKKLDDANYFAHFEAQTVSFLTHDSDCIFHVGQKGARWQFSGQEDLGMLFGGIYKYAGRVDANEFYCTYDSKMDKGIFRMTRPPAATQPR